MKQMTPLERKILKAKKATPVKFAEGLDTIYFIKGETTAKCHFCKKVFTTGDPYNVSSDGRHFKHVKCGIDKVKQ
jgi:hypothetical protein